MVDQSVPAAQVASLQKSVASLAGITPARGDTLAVSRLTFAKQPATTTTATSPIAGIMANPFDLLKKVGMGLAALIFLFMMRRALKRREGESSVPEPTWLREIERGMTVAELEAAPAMAALPSPQDDAHREVREAVEEIANNQPQAIAHQVTAWMKE